MKFYKEYIFAALMLIFLVAFLFNELIGGSFIFTSGDTLSPIAVKNALLNYSSKYSYFPLWFPWILGGMPMVHSLMSISNYYLPHHIMLLLHGLGIPWFWYFIFHLSFGGLGMYSLLRYLKQHQYISLFGSLLFTFMPYMITMTAYGHGSQMMTASYIPWIILFLFKIYDKNKLIDYALFSLLIGLQLLRGHIQISYYTWMMIGLFFVLSLFNNKNISLIRIFKKNVLLLFSLFLGVLLSLSIYLPVLNYSSFSTRGSSSGGVGIDYATQWSMSFKELFTLIFPYSMGFGGKLYFGDLPFTDFPNYIGILIITFSFIGLLKSKLKQHYKIYFLLIVVFSILISLGSNFIQFYNIFYNYFPHFNKFRVPSYILILTNFSLIILSSFGLSFILKSINNQFSNNKNIYLILFLPLLVSILYIINYKLLIPDSYLNYDILINQIKQDGYFLCIISFLILISFILFNYKKYNSNIFCIFVTVITFIDYYRINSEIINPQNHIPHKKIIQSSDYIDNYLLKDELTDYLLNDTSKYRILDFVGDQNRWAIHNIDNISGYYPAKLNNYQMFLNNINSRGYQIWPEGVLKLLNIKYFVLPGPVIDNSLFNNLGYKEMYFFGNYKEFNGKLVDVSLYKYNSFAKRLFFTNQIQFLDKISIYNEVLSDNYDPYEIAYIESENLNVKDHMINQSFDLSGRTVEILHWEADKIRFKTSSGSDQFLIMSEIFYPNGWEVYNNGSKHKIYEVNNLVRGLFIPKGENEFIMIFKPNDIKLGKYISIIGYLLILLLILLHYKKHSIKVNEKI